MPSIHTHRETFEKLSITKTQFRLTIHTLHVNIPCGACTILLTLVVVAFTDETHDVWCTVVDPVDCWLIVVLVFVNIVVMMGIDDEELNASKISTCNNKKYNKLEDWICVEFKY